MLGISLDQQISLPMSSINLFLKVLTNNVFQRLLTSIGLTICSFAYLGGSVQAQNPAMDPPLESETVTVKLAEGSISPFPFNVKTAWQGEVSYRNVDRVELRFRELVKGGCTGIETVEPEVWTKPISDSANSERALFRIPVSSQSAFRPGRSYCVHITLERPVQNDGADQCTEKEQETKNAGAQPKCIQSNPSSARGWRVKKPDAYASRTAEVKTFVINSTPRAGLKHYLSTSVGAAYALKAETWIASYMLNVHLGAINKNTDLGGRLTPRQHVAQRVSFFLGLSPVTIYSYADGGVRDLTPVGNITVGASVRSLLYPSVFRGRLARAVLEPLVIDVGFFRYAQRHANPLVNDEITKDSFLIGLSYDIGITKILTPIAGLLQ